MGIKLLSDFQQNVIADLCHNIHTCFDEHYQQQIQSQGYAKHRIQSLEILIRNIYIDSLLHNDGIHQTDDYTISHHEKHHQHLPFIPQQIAKKPLHGFYFASLLQLFVFLI